LSPGEKEGHKPFNPPSEKAKTMLLDRQDYSITIPPDVVPFCRIQEDLNVSNVTLLSIATDGEIDSCVTTSRITMILFGKINCLIRNNGLNSG